uniref:Venom serine protease n=1 Tax=Aphidius ervi TaxID=37627 RepID=A0A034WUA6_APHER
MLTAALLGIVIGGPVCPVQSAANISCNLRTLQLDRVCGYNLKASESLKKPKGAWNSANFGEFPWTAAILGKSGNDEFHICDGSLIHPQVILTVASCAKNLSPGRHYIRVGATDPKLQQINEPQDRVIDHIIVNQNFIEKTMENNVALLWFHNPINISADNADLVCLPTTNQEFDDKKCQISILDRNSEDVSDETDDAEETDNEIHSSKPDAKKFDLSIKKVELEIVGKKKCDLKFAKSTICAKSPARLHVCEAKIGSSIVCQHANDPTRWVHAGSVAFKCDDPYEKRADPYINIAKSSLWIKNQLSELRKKGELRE